MKPRLFKLVVFLLLGAVVNVAVAWGIAIRPIEEVPWPERFFAIREYYERFGPDPLIHVRTTIYSRPGEFELSQHELPLSYLRVAIFPEPLDEAGFRALVPTWSRLAAAEPFQEFVKHSDVDHELVDYTEYASGWPAYSLRYYGPIYSVRAGSGNVYDESRMTGYFHPTLPQAMVNGGYRSELPFLPIWPGFAINTVFYAAILWLLTFGPFAARRVIRRKRGHCIKCGYDLRGDVSAGCPECGWQREDVP